MKLGLGLYPNILTDDNLRFAKQIGATHIVAWMPLPAGNGVWEYEDLLRLRQHIESCGLQIAAIENLPPEHWYKILLGEPGREEQLENVKATVRNMGKAGIPCLGYCFTIVGVWGHWRHGDQGGGRGDAGVKSFDYERVRDASPLPRNQVWGWTIPGESAESLMGDVSRDQLWERVRYFIENIIPVAEEAGVKLAAHPDDPPVPKLRGIPRLFHNPEAYQRLIDMVPSDSNGLEFCQGTVAEMGVDVIETIRHFGEQRKIFYVHFRNVRGTVPRFDEVFIDDGDVDMVAAMKAYRDVGFDGVLIPDHSPRLTCDASWHAGMAFAIGYMRAVLQAMEGHGL